MLYVTVVDCFKTGFIGVAHFIDYDLQPVSYLVQKRDTDGSRARRASGR